MTPISLYIAIGFTVFLSLSLLMGIVILRPSPEAQRLRDAITSSRHDQRKIGQKERVEEGLLKLAGNVRSRFGLSANTKLKQRLAAAGLRDPATADLFFAAQCLIPLAGAFGGSFITSNTLFWICSLAAIGYIVPDFWLTEKIRRRKQRIVRSMPDAIDLLVICVDAGLGLDQALLRVGEEIALGHPDIHEEFTRVHLEQRAGRPRLETWQNLASRTQIPEFAAFVSMLTQTDRFGTPIIKALSRFADDLRLKRRQKVEESAAKTKIKIIFPLVFCIFPALFIVLLAPALMSIASELKGIGK
jgi:tight adherence protein C